MHIVIGALQKEEHAQASFEKLQGWVDFPLRTEMNWGTEWILTNWTGGKVMNPNKNLINTETSFIDWAWNEEIII